MGSPDRGTAAVAMDCLWLGTQKSRATGGVTSFALCALLPSLYAPWCRWRYPSPNWTAIHRTTMMTGVIHSDGSGEPVAQRTSTSAATASASLTVELLRAMTFSTGFMMDSRSAQ